MAVEWENGIPILTGESLLSDVPEYTQALAAASIMPVGAIMPYMGIAAPDFWLFCDGRSYDAAYFDVLSGVSANFHGDGVFRVPDLRGRVPLGQTQITYGTNHPDFPDIPDGAWGNPVCAVALGQRWGDWRLHAHTHEVYPKYKNGQVQTDTFEHFSSFADGGPETYGTSINGTGQGQNLSPYTGVNFIVYSGKPTLDTNGDILPECGQGAEIAPVTTRQMIEARLAAKGIGEEEVKMLKEQLEILKERLATLKEQDAK